MKVLDWVYLNSLSNYNNKQLSVDSWFGTPIQIWSANFWSWKTSFGVRYPKHFRGLLLIDSTALASFRGFKFSRSFPFGKYCRSSPLVCSFNPRSQEWYGCAKYMGIRIFRASALCWANSLPLSTVNDFLNFAGIRLKSSSAAWFKHSVVLLGIG